MLYNERLHDYFGRWYEMVKKYDDGSVALKPGEITTFKAFISWIIDDQANALEEEMDHHWGSMFTLCAPCYQKFTLISKIEEMDASGDMMLRALKLPEAIGRFPVKYKIGKYKNNTESENHRPIQILNFDNHVLHSLCQVWISWLTRIGMQG